MKICASCRKLNDNNAEFCKTCGGTKFMQSTTPKYNAIMPEENKAPRWGVLDIIKNYGSCCMFKWMTVLLILMAICSFLIGIAVLYSFRNVHIELKKQDIHQLDQFFVYLIALIALFTVLTLGLRVSLWKGMMKFRETSHLYANDKFELKGLNIIRSTLVIRMAVQIVLILCFIILLYYLANLSFDGSTPFENLQSNVWTYIIILLLYMPFMITYSLLLIKTVNSVIRSANGTLTKYVSMYVIVYNFVIAFFILLTAFSAGLINKIFAADYVAFHILFSIMLLRYKAEISVCRTTFEFDSPDLSSQKLKTL